jgi:hypothetical protein
MLLDVVADSSCSDAEAYVFADSLRLAPEMVRNSLPSDFVRMRGLLSKLVKQLK